MSDTIREKIIAAFAAGLEDIRTENDFITEAGQTVKRGQQVVDSDKLPGLSVLPFTEENEQIIGGKNSLSMRIRINGLIKFASSQNPSILAEQLLGDLKKRVTNRDLVDSLGSIHGGYADKVQYAEGGADEYPEPGQWTVAVHATFNISYKEKLGDPYNQ